MLTTFILVVIIAGVITLDQISKLLVVSFMELGEGIEILPSFFRLRYITNPGMSFGLFGEGDKRWIFMVISPIALIAIAVYLFKFSKDRLPMKIGLSFILGGGLSNMIDRTFYGDSIFHGEVIDMFDFYGIWQAIFNVADSFVCIGAALVVLTLIVDIILEKKDTKKDALEKAKSLNEKMTGSVSRELPKPTIDNANETKNSEKQTLPEEFSKNGEEKD